MQEVHLLMGFFTHCIHVGFKGQLVVDGSAQIFVLMCALYCLIIDHHREDEQLILPKINDHLLGFEYVIAQEG